MARLRVLFPAIAVASVIAAIPALAQAGGFTNITDPFTGKSLHLEKGNTWKMPDSGTATIIAETLTIDGTITADDVGNLGVSGADGMGMGAGHAGQSGAAPGGGAGFFGKGGPGIEFVDAGVCDPDPMGGAGGPAFVTINNLKKLLGSAGGGSGIDHGGAGGGHIIINATTVILNDTGIITADGQAPGHVGGYAGGGSGGVIEIHAVTLMGTGKILARGGSGAQSSVAAGGAGAGGVVLLDLVNPWSGTPDVSGGKAAGCAEGDGAKGTVFHSTPMNDCVDADGDGFYPKACAPKGAKVDCDDSDLTVFPGAPEWCDSKDNNCDDIVDNDLEPDACPAHAACVDGGCVTQHKVDAGMMDDGGASPDRIDFEGGCDVTPAATASGFAASFAALAGLGLVLRSRLRRKKRR